MRTLLALAALASFHFANGAPSAVLVADNPSGSFTGTWPASTSVSGYLGRNYQHHAAGMGSDIFTWTLKVPSAGTYKVYARWTQHANRATDATYTVTHAGGSTAVSVNQQAGGGAWNLLGTFAFARGTAHKVTLTDQANGYVVADAIRLVPVSVQAEKKVQDEKKLYFVHTDHLNTPRLVADASGTTVWRWDQAEPFGNNPADEDPSGLGAFDLPLRLPGQRYDAETRLHYNYFRDYDSGIGRYVQSDPIGLVAGLNTYAYVDSSPLLGRDPLGLTSHGCGSGRTHGRTPNLWFRECCDAHDACYDDCKGLPPKSQCDSTFCSCVYSKCTGWANSIACHAAAATFCTGVTATPAAQRAFDDARSKCRRQPMACLPAPKQS
ncbi:MAG: RHS repeat-associated core domain-containing protein [Burkholderiales bacterium]